jgi:hypothetical protein
LVTVKLDPLGVHDERGVPEHALLLAQRPVLLTVHGAESNQTFQFLRYFTPLKTDGEFSFKSIFQASKIF